MTNGTLLALRKRLGDPLLTVLTLMLAILMFVVGPLQAAGIVAAHHFGLAFGLVLMAAVFIVSGSPASLAAMLVAIALIALSTVLRVYRRRDTEHRRLPRRVLRGTDHVSSRRRGDPALPQHRVDFRGVVLFRRPARAQCICRPRSAARQSRRRRKLDLFQLRYADVGGLRRHCALAPVRARSSRPSSVSYPATLLARLVTLELESRRRF